MIHISTVTLLKNCSELLEGDRRIFMSDYIGIHDDIIHTLYRENVAYQIYYCCVTNINKITVLGNYYYRFICKNVSFQRMFQTEYEMLEQIF